MAQIIWAEPALTDLDTIADYIALDNAEAARRLVQRIFKHVEQLERYPKSGSVPAELRGSRYRQIVEPPCRVFYRPDGKRVWILHVMRSEKLLRPSQLRERDRKTRPSRVHEIIGNRRRDSKGCLVRSPNNSTLWGGILESCVAEIKALAIDALFEQPSVLCTSTAERLNELCCFL